MRDEADISILPRWRLTRWLVDPGVDVPPAIRASLVAGLYGSIPIFVGGVVNTVAVSAVIAARIPTFPFLLWAGFEMLLSAVRLVALIDGRRAVAEARPGPTDLYILLALLWAAGIGFGAFISIASGDWVAATLACFSSAGMVGGLCFRNFGAPRLAAMMILLSLGPCAAAALLSGEPILLVIAVQIPLYLASMTLAAFHLNRMLVTTMRAERDYDHQARHDPLTGLLNRAGLDRRLGLAAHEGAAGLTLFYLDLDGFKGINDGFGHAAGDALLASVADRVKALVRAGDAVARVGGDEFVIAAPGLTREAGAGMAQRLVADISDRPHMIGGYAVFVGVSIGVAAAGEGGETLAELLAAADTALYRAKASGRSRYAIAGTREEPRVNDSLTPGGYAAQRA